MARLFSLNFQRKLIFMAAAPLWIVACRTGYIVEIQENHPIEMKTSFNHEVHVISTSSLRITHLNSTFNKF
jgi:hypothetical protein